MRGTVKFWDDRRGFGFVTPDDGTKPDAVLHSTVMHWARMEFRHSRQRWRSSAGSRCRSAWPLNHSITGVHMG